MNSSSDSDSYFSYPSEENRDSSSQDSSGESTDDDEEFTKVVKIFQCFVHELGKETSFWHSPVKTVDEGDEKIIIHPKERDNGLPHYENIIQQIRQMGLDRAYVYVSSCLFVTLNISKDVRESKSHLCDILILSSIFPPILITKFNRHKLEGRNDSYSIRLTQNLNRKLRIEAKQDLKCLLFELEEEELISKEDIVAMINEEDKFANSLTLKSSYENYELLVEVLHRMICNCSTAKFITTNEHFTVEDSGTQKTFTEEEFHIITGALDGRYQEFHFKTAGDSLFLKTEVAARMSRKKKTMLKIPRYQLNRLDLEALRQEYPNLVPICSREEPTADVFKYIVTGEEEELNITSKILWAEMSSVNFPSSMVPGNFQTTDDFSLLSSFPLLTHERSLESSGYISEPTKLKGFKHLPQVNDTNPQSRAIRIPRKRFLSEGGQVKKNLSNYPRFSVSSAVTQEEYESSRMEDIGRSHLYTGPIMSFQYKTNASTGVRNKPIKRLSAKRPESTRISKR